jgi:hypothetical protein
MSGAERTSSMNWNLLVDVLVLVIRVLSIACLAAGAAVALLETLDRGSE